MNDAERWEPLTTAGTPGAPRLRVVEVATAFLAYVEWAEADPDERGSYVAMMAFSAGWKAAGGPLLGEDGERVSP